MAKWNYVNTKENLADIITRTNEMNVINDMTWLKPPFLRQISGVETTTLNETMMTFNVSRNGAQYSMSKEDFHDEVKDDDTYVLIATRDTPSVCNLIDTDSYHTSFKLLTIIALILKFVHNIHQWMQRRKNVSNPF